ncbi:hypothetical protein HPO96_02755 [Kribbella sandramycini]|uniref:Putative membrane protein n=1 Tax=Kribbella sandramycini TaxID=60450 RepID=A0A7Y4KUZ9_9ACTN|nr:hypothetical protein [Kribbella sandramycini]MBB6568250.1 putative membrane protein [Kribbella sandramycini]NOL39157.1 hypothetical protein [Kribbella sandramycini]
MRRLLVSGVALVLGAMPVTASAARSGEGPCRRETVAGIPGMYAVAIQQTDPTGRFQVGYAKATARGESRLVLWRDGTPLDQGPVGGLDAGWLDVNARGQVAGNGRVGGVDKLWRWSQTGGLEPLPLPANTTDGAVMAINGRGEMAGAAWAGEDPVAVAWSADKTLRVLATPAGFTRAHAYDIDGDGTVVGEVWDWDREGAGWRARRAIAWAPDGSWRLLPRGSSDRAHSYARVIRDGAVLGVTSGDDTFSWVERNGTLTRVGELYPTLLGINSTGAILTDSDVRTPGGTPRKLPEIDGADPMDGGSYPTGITDTDLVYGYDWLDGDRRLMPVRWDCR